MIEIKDVTYTYNEADQPALEKLSISISKGECVLLCGKSGCGKSTVTRLLNGMIPNFYEGKLSGRLRALFDLSLSPGGALSGTVRLQARGAWRSLFFRAWEDGRAGELLPSLFRNLRGYEAAALKESGGEAELAFSIGEMPGIMGTQGKNLLVILPAFVPESFRNYSQ